MRLLIIAVAVLLPGNVVAAELGYDDVFIHYRYNQLDNPGYPDTLQGWGVKVNRSIADAWFVEAHVLYSDNSWNEQYLTAYGAEEYAIPEHPYWRTEIENASETMLYTSIGLGRFWPIGEKMHLTATGFLTYLDVEYSDTWTASLVDPWTQPEEILSRSEGMREISVHDLGYRFELGLRSLVISNLELFGLAAHSAQFDSTGTSFHAGARYRVLDALDLTARYVKTESLESWWSGVVVRY